MSDIKNLVSQNPLTRRTLLKLSGYGMMAIPFLESLSVGKARGQSGNAPMGMTKNLVNLIAPEGCHHYRLQGTPGSIENYQTSSLNPRIQYSPKFKNLPLIVNGISPEVIAELSWILGTSSQGLAAQHAGQMWKGHSLKGSRFSMEAMPGDGPQVGTYDYAIANYLKNSGQSCNTYYFRISSGSQYLNPFGQNLSNVCDNNGNFFAATSSLQTMLNQILKVAPDLGSGGNGGSGSGSGGSSNGNSGGGSGGNPPGGTINRNHFFKIALEKITSLASSSALSATDKFNLNNYASVLRDVQKTFNVPLNQINNEQRSFASQQLSQISVPPIPSLGNIGMVDGIDSPALTTYQSRKDYLDAFTSLVCLACSVSGNNLIDITSYHPLNPDLSVNTNLHYGSHEGSIIQSLNSDSIDCHKPQADFIQSIFKNVFSEIVRKWKMYGLSDYSMGVFSPTFFYANNHVVHHIVQNTGRSGSLPIILAGRAKSTNGSNLITPGIWNYQKNISSNQGTLNLPLANGALFGLAFQYFDVPENVYAINGIGYGYHIRDQNLYGKEYSGNGYHPEMYSSDPNLKRVCKFS